MIRSVLLIATLLLALPRAAAQEEAPDVTEPPAITVDEPEPTGPEQILDQAAGESPEAYQDRVRQLPPLPLGTARLLPPSPEVPRGHLPVEVRFQSWAAAWQPRKPLTLDPVTPGLPVDQTTELAVEGRFEVRDGKPVCGGLEVVTATGRIPLRAEAPFVPGAAANVQGAWEARLALQGVDVNLVLVPAGRFVREPEAGTYKSGAYRMEGQVRPLFSRDPGVVCLSQAFWIGKVPVTQGQYAAVMGRNPSAFQQAGPEAPVESVTWDEAQAFIARLNSLQDTFAFRLPTEAEWELASRAGSEFSIYGPKAEIAWYKDNSGGTTHPVGRKLPNDLGLYDTLGNVMAWCQDWHGDYPEGGTVDPRGPATGQCRVIRGCAWNSAPDRVSVELRQYNAPNQRASGLGFRLAASRRTP